LNQEPTTSQTNASAILAEPGCGSSGAQVDTPAVDYVRQPAAVLHMAIEAGVDPLLLPPPPLASSCVQSSRRASSMAWWARLLLDDLDHLLLCDTVVSHRRRHCNILLRI